MAGNFRDFKRTEKLTDISGTGKVEKEKAGAGAGTGGSNRDNNSKTSETEKAGAGAGAGAGDSGDSGAGKAEKTKEPVEVAILVPPKSEEKPKRKRKTKAKQETPAFGSNEISALMVSISAVVASREGMAHWKISEKEANSIAEPLTNILEKSEVFKTLAEHSDSIALVTACTMVFAPRVMLTATVAKAKKKESKGNVKQFKTRAEGNKSGTPQNDSKPINGGSKSGNAANGENIFNEFAVVNPIC